MKIKRCLVVKSTCNPDFFFSNVKKFNSVMHAVTLSIHSELQALSYTLKFSAVLL